MSAELTLGVAFLTGILGSFHCLGMCSGINTGFFIHFAPRLRLSHLLTYHTLRIAVYTLLGIGGAVVGQVLVQSGIVGKAQGLLMILAGGLVVLLGLNLLGVSLNRAVKVRPVTHVVSLTGLNKSISLPTVMAGLLNGLVPCSLVFSVAVKAVSTADPLTAGLLMLSFGAGTLPSMVTASLLGGYVGKTFRGALARLAGVLVVVLGLWTVYEGVVFYDIMRGLANW
ncbi:MAG: sulfite exporter TauE/SafE family protein [Candidatus Thiodiazotropha lotti]|nr:sulfite exporter TauE/SafE family protein [Candidatus Thiodiazotropha lotti]MCG8000748.1 sulfite exporter TauE/SafE family protein [Candidatus Thiodiazotropha lotti]MCW4184804.1 sulfite exporter TauE/SafE family protein [Candidatus Thiodiazotropha weberae]MCW4192521.1 sulfite exporter TauE/SafE family protein [Candidatus Thiodiazotropha weberae]